MAEPRQPSGPGKPGEAGKDQDTDVGRHGVPADAKDGEAKGHPSDDRLETETGPHGTSPAH